MNWNKIAKHTGLTQNNKVSIFYLELPLIPQLYKDNKGLWIVSKLVIRGGFKDSENPFIFEYHGSFKPKFSRYGFQPHSVVSKVASYSTEDELITAFDIWKSEARNILKHMEV